MVCRIFPDRPFGDNDLVNLVHAAHDIEMPLAGFTIEEIQFSLQNVLNVDMHADAYVDGRLALPSRRLLPGNRIEFMQRWGKKRAIDIRPDWESADGGIQLYCGDCRLILPRLKHVGDSAIVDPPYNIGYHYNTYKDRMGSAEYLTWQEEVMAAAQIALKPDANVFYLQYPEIASEMWARLKRYYNPVEWITWIYHTHTGGRPFRRGSRAWLWLAQGNPYIGDDALRGHYRNPDDRRIRERIEKGLRPIDFDWWFCEQVKNVSREKTPHPCQLPVEMVERIVQADLSGRWNGHRPLLGQRHHRRSVHPVGATVHRHRNRRRVFSYRGEEDRRDQYEERNR